ncbi:MAG: glycosyltransferase family 39 protein [Candidatus Eisenbacteria bacterium]|nr:glycosyltransferase family 39 protein [Candidatus Eisenbacteria bacterium]
MKPKVGSRARPQAPRPSPAPHFSSPAVASALGLAALLVTMGARLMPSLGLAFYNDDFVYIDAVSRRGWLEGLLHPLRIGGYLRPFSRDLHFALGNRVLGMDAFGYHLVNLALALLCTVMVWRLGRRWIGPRGALLAASLFGLSHAHAVLVGWISCDQDLWALCFSLACALWLGSGRTALSAAAFALALLSKESVAPLPLALVALLAQERPHGRAWRAVAPHFVVLAVWAAWYAAARGPESSLRWDAEAALWLPLRFLLAAGGVEGGRLWPAGVTAAPPWALLAGAGCVGAALAALRPVPEAARRALPWLTWAALGLLPVLPVAGQWSAYYFAFPLAGLYLALGALAERWPFAAVAPLPALLLLLGQGSLNLVYNPSAPRQSPWISSVSVGRLAMGSRIVVAALRQIPEVLPAPPRGALFVFNGLPFRNGLISGDGPAMRLLYADTTLRACYLGEIQEGFDFDRPLLAFSWDDRAASFGFARLEGDALRAFKYDLEISGRTRAALAVTRHEARTTGAAGAGSAAWNLGYMLWESGDTVAAKAEWARAAGGITADAGGPQESLARSRALPPGPQRLAALLRALRSHPRDGRLLAEAAREALAQDNDLGVALYYRACVVAPYSAPLAHEAREALADRNVPTTVALVDSVLREAAAGRAR